MCLRIIKVNSKAINKFDKNLTSFKNFSQKELKNCSRLYARLDNYRDL